VLTGEKEVPAGDAADFIALEPGDRMVVEGRILAASPVPVPGSVPYKDHIRSLHLSDIRNLDGAGPAGRQALVYVWSMRDNQWTEAAQWDAGDRVQLALSSWYAREDELGSINRSEIDDFELQLQDPCWGEPSVSP
jgi:alginate O-acetyltransferase complex protein AlgJ